MPTKSTGGSEMFGLVKSKQMVQNLNNRGIFENLYSPHNSDSSCSDKINTKLYNKNTKKINLTRT